MKRLLFLMTVAMFAASATGCGWFRPYRSCGDPCASYSPNVSGYEASYPPAATSSTPHLLPGPAVQVLPPG